MIDYARYQRDYEKEQEGKGIWPYYSDLPLIKYCHAFGFPVHSHEYFRDVTKRWPYVLCEIPNVRLIAIPNVGIGFLSRGLEEHLLFDCISANGFKAEKRMKSNPPQESFRPYDGYAGDAALLIGSSPPFGDFLNCQFTRLMYRDLFPHLKDTPLITSAGMGASSYDLFNAIGIPTEQVIRLPDYHFIECERLFVPTILAGLSAELDNFFYPPEPAHWLRDRLTVACCEEDAENPPTPTRKVYISRKSAKQRVTGNEDEIIELVGSAGYEIIDPSDYSICEQVNIARETKQFISLAGSQTNLVNFAQSGARFCELKIKEYMERRILGYLRVFPLLGIEHIQVFYKELDDEDYTIDVGKLAVALQKFDFL